MVKRILEKTNIRVFNRYLIMKKKKVNKELVYNFYLTNITDIDKWINISDSQDELEKLKGDKITDNIIKYMDEADSYSNVNFHIPEFEDKMINENKIVKMGG